MFGHFSSWQSSEDLQHTLHMVELTNEQNMKFYKLLNVQWARNSLLFVKRRIRLCIVSTTCHCRRERSGMNWLHNRECFNYMHILMTSFPCLCFDGMGFSIWLENCVIHGNENVEDCCCCRCCCWCCCCCHSRRR